MNHELKASGTVDINASPERVWKVLTDPSLIKEYLFGTEAITDWKVGSPITFQGEYEGQQYQDKGIVKENHLHKKISYHYWSSFSGTEDVPENYCLVSYDLDSKDGKRTRFTWTQKGYASEEGQEHSQSGMDEFLQHIKQIAERK